MSINNDNVFSGCELKSDLSFTFSIKNFPVIFHSFAEMQKKVDSSADDDYEINIVASIWAPGLNGDRSIIGKIFFRQHLFVYEALLSEYAPEKMWSDLKFRQVFLKALSQFLSKNDQKIDPKRKNALRELIERETFKLNIQTLARRLQNLDPWVVRYNVKFKKTLSALEKSF